MSLPTTSDSDNGWSGVDPLAAIAHDLRQPIATLRALVGTLKASDVTLDDLHWHLERMDSQIDDLGDLVRCLAGLLAADSDLDGVEDPRPVPANDSVAEVTRSFAVTWPGQVVTAFGHDALLQAPPQMLRRSVRNLLDNAGRAAGTDGMILISVNNSDLGTSIAVDDDGPGFGAIPAQNSIGLKVVGKTLSKAGGRLEVSTSETLGGARVELLFPAQQEQAGNAR
jgi:two-component system sensor histidine kinase RstB